MRLMATIAVLAGCSVSAVGATVTPISQTRSVTYVTLNSNPPVTTQTDAPGDGPFTASYGNPAGAYAYQDSSISTYVVTADMRAVSASSVRTTSLLVYDFTVTTPVAYSITATFYASQNYDAFADVILWLRNANLGPGQDVFFWGREGSKSASGMLEPGDYRLGAALSADYGSQGGSNTASTQFTITLPEPTMVLLLLPGMGLLRRRGLRA